MTEGSEVDQKFDYTLDEAAEVIHTVFLDQRWRWWGSGVPTVEEIRANILEQIKVLKGDCTWSSCGRINVHRDPDINNVVVSVEFALNDQ